MSSLVRLFGRNSPGYQRYFDDQSPERQEELRLAERLYNDSRRFQGDDPMERAYLESFFGFTESPAGGFDKG